MRHRQRHLIAEQERRSKQRVLGRRLRETFDDLEGHEPLDELFELLSAADERRRKNAKW